jgi:hypothetical protein
MSPSRASTPGAASPPEAVPHRHDLPRRGLDPDQQTVIYPILDNVDGDGNQLINCMARSSARPRQERLEPAGILADFYQICGDWRFDWLDVAELIRVADRILEHPMVD